MYKLEIGEDTYTLDGSWTIEQWMELQKYDSSLDIMWPKLISKATGAPIEQCVQIPNETLEVGVALVASLMAPSWSKPKKRYLKGELVEFDRMTIGQFMDCEVAVGRGLDKWMHLLIGTLYNVNIESCLHWELKTVYPAAHAYMNWRLDLYKKYDSLFELSERDSEDTENASDSAYAWYDMLMVLADEKFLNIKDAAERPVYEALNYMAWKKDMAKKEELERKKLKI